MRRRAAIAPAGAAVLALACRIVAAGEPVCDRVVSMGDLHGGYEPFVKMLRETRLIDDDGAFSDPRACFVQLGDVADRGGRPRLIYERLMELERQAPGRVETLLGNHEVMNVSGDLRYTNRSEFEEFATDETPEERTAGFEAFRKSGLASGDEKTDREEFDRRYPPGWFAHRRAFAPDGRYGSWILRRPVLRLLNGTLYVHGGIADEVVRRGIADVNERASVEIAEYARLRSRLVAAGVFGDLVPFTETFPIVEAKLQEVSRGPAGAGEPVWAGEARRYLALSTAVAFDAAGPLWTRELSKLDEGTLAERLARDLPKLGAERVVAGHTTQDDGRIHVRGGGRAFLIDTGAGPAYGGRSSALQIDWTGRTVAIYPEGEELLAEGSAPDDVAERFMREGRVIESHEIGSGITHPKRVVLDRGGLTLAAAFKSVDIHEQEPIRMARSGMTFEYTDSYKNERAAYLLDRMLGIGMVPPSVIRKLDGVEGALVLWVRDAVTEKDRVERGIKPADPFALTHPRDVMAVFDALIANVDRNQGNQLTTTIDLKLHLIDHSRSFRLQHTLSEAYGKTPSCLPRALYDGLVALDEKRLDAALEGLVTRAQVKALLYRRDAIVHKVEADRKKYGDAMVFHESAPPIDR